MSPSALITRQDGSYLAAMLLDKGHEVHLARRSSYFNTGRIEHPNHDPHVTDTRLRLHYGDPLDSSSLRRLIDETHPDEVYHLFARPHVRVSFEMPECTTQTSVLGATRLREAIRQFDPSMPDGQLRRRLDSSRAEKGFGFRAATSFEVGLRETVKSYSEHRLF